MSDTGTWLVVGLGNPGPAYAGNRHNVGAMVLDVLGARVGGAFKSHRSRAAVLEGRLGVLPGGAPGPRAVLAKPSSYMNESGGPVSALLKFYKVEPERLVVVHDELDIPFAQVRLKLGGGEGGHNGLRSVSRSTGTRDYLRVRVGVGRPPGGQDPADFVLRDFSTSERKELPLLLEDAADAVEAVVGSGLVAAQQRFHSPGS
ncbi:MAG TPA: aminoacyl-tRNA hydrolase [Angustibacter sp.]|nr:aminoacyl-tRNA hydrolase [Angustibacter sp.]